jgi:general secretion pathway protein G
MIQTNSLSMRSKLRVNDQSGFTLLEIMAVVMIILLLVGVAITQIGGTTTVAREKAVEAMIKGSFKQTLGMYNMENGMYPSTEQGLKALVEKPGSDPVPASWRPYLEDKNVPKDPWGKDYIYVCPGTHNPDSYDLSSPGKDGIAGNENDITNWK